MLMYSIVHSHIVNIMLELYLLKILFIWKMIIITDLMIITSIILQVVVNLAVS